MRNAPGFIFASAAASIMWRVSRVSGACSETMSLVASSSSIGAPRERVRQQRDRRIGLGEDGDDVVFGALLLRRMLDEVGERREDVAGDGGVVGGEDDGMSHETCAELRIPNTE